MGTVNYLVTNILKNILSSLQQRKETHTVLENLKREKMGWKFNLWVDYPFKRVQCFVNVVAFLWCQSWSTDLK